MAEIVYNPFSSRKNGLSILARCIIIIRPSETAHIHHSPSSKSLRTGIVRPRASTASSESSASSTHSSSSKRSSRKRRKRLAVLLFDNKKREGYIFCFKTEKHWDYFQHLHSKLFVDETDISWNRILSDQYLNQVIQLEDAHIDARTLPKDKKETYFPKANVIFIQRNESQNPLSLTATSLNGSYLIFKDDDYIQWIGWMQKIKIASSFQRRSESLQSESLNASDIESAYAKLNDMIGQVEERVHAIPTPEYHPNDSSTIDSEADKAEVTVSNSEEYELINGVGYEMEEKCAELVTNINLSTSVSSSVTTPSSEDIVIDDVLPNKRKFDCGEKRMLMITFLFMGILTVGYLKYSLYQQAKLEQEAAAYLEMLRNKEIEANMQEMTQSLYQDGILLAKVMVLVIIIIINCCCCGKVYLCRRTLPNCDDQERRTQIKKQPKAKHKYNLRKRKK